MSSVTIKIEGEKGSGKTMISAIIYKALKDAGFFDVEIDGPERKIHKLTNKRNLRSEFIYFFNIENRKITIKEMPHNPPKPTIGQRDIAVGG